MSRLADLIAELCPDGVEYRPLGEIADLQRGGGMPKKLFIDKGIPAIHYGHIFTKYGIHTKCAAAYLAPEDTDKLTRVYPGDLVVANTSENLEDVGKGVVWLGDVEGVTGGHATVVRSLAVDTVFLSYYLRTEDFALKKRKYAQGTKVIELSAVNLSKIDIPVPPLEVQREIVRILDQFTTLEAELEAELEARRTQYEHYRNRLLSYDSLSACGPVDMVELGSVVTLLDSRRIPLKKGDRVSGEYPYYGASGIVDYVDSYIFDEDLLLVSEDGANLKARTKPIAFSSSGRVWVNNHAHVLKVESSLYQKFLEEYLNSLDLEPYLVGSTQPKLNQSGLLSIPVPLPTERALERSVLLLEKLKLFVTDFSSGLPAEIAARRAQYEHYRDRLLSFPEKAVSRSNAS
jgi:type I restriction enzyme specificity protein hsdS